MKMLNRLVVMTTLAMAISSAQGSLIGYVESGTPLDVAGYGASGFKFTINAPIQVTDLGFRAVSIGGGDLAHVMLWDVTTSTLLADTGAALHGALTNGWHYTTLTSPVVLDVAHTYEVAADIYWVPSYSSISGFTYGSEIAPVDFVKGAGGFGGWTTYDSAPLSISASPATIGANFQYVLVPEPTALAPLAAGLLIAARRRRV